MAGEELAFRRVALGGPISEYGRRIDDVRLNKFGTDTSFGTAASTVFTNVTASATPHTVGAYAQLIASTSKRIRRLTVGVGQISSGGTDTGALLNIAIGAAASEVVIIPNIDVGGAAAPFSQVQTEFMVDIPAGTRIAASLQGVVVSQTARVSITGFAEGRGLPSPAAVVTYGAVTATSRGTAFTAAGAANTLSAWTQATASTTAPHKYLTVSSGLSTASSGDETGSVDIGIGPGGSEVVIGTAVIQYFVQANESMAYMMMSPAVLANIPAGTRVAVRYRASDVSGVGRFCVHGQ